MYYLSSGKLGWTNDVPVSHIIVYDETDIMLCGTFEISDYSFVLFTIYRVQQLDVKVETKTLDNVFIQTMVSIQYQVLPDKAYDAYYELTNPEQQITVHIYDAMSPQLPTLELDAVFGAREKLVLTVKNSLTEIMGQYCIQILQALISDLDP